MMIVKKSKNGFIAISIIYSFFLVFVLLILLIISTLIANRNNDNIYILDIKNRLATQNNPESKPSIPDPTPTDTKSPSCTLKVSGYVITWEEKSDDTGITKYGLGNTRDLDNGKDFLVIAEGTFYGTVYDAAGNKGSCSIEVETGWDLEYTTEVRCCPIENQHVDAAGNPYCSTIEYTRSFHKGKECVDINQIFCSDFACKLTSASCKDGYTNPSGTKYCYKIGS